MFHHVGNESSCKKVTPGAPFFGAPGARGEDKEGGSENIFGGDNVNAGSCHVGQEHVTDVDRGLGGDAL